MTEQDSTTPVHKDSLIGHEGRVVLLAFLAVLGQGAFRKMVFGLGALVIALAVGGTCAVWVRAGERVGTVRLTAKHPRLGEQSVSFTLTTVPEEVV